MIHTRVGQMALVCAALVSLGGEASALNVAEWAKAFAKPTLAGPGVDAKGRSFAVGHVRLSFAAGRLYAVKAGDAVVGAYFVGQGDLRYISGDPLEAAAYRTNVGRLSSYKVDKDGAVGDTVESALIMLSAGADALVGGAASAAGDAPIDAKERFVKHLERYAEDQSLRYAQIMPQAMVDPPAQAVAVVEAVASKDDLFYVFDPLRDHNEWLAVMEKSRSDLPFLKKHRYPEVLSEQVVGRKRLEPNPIPFFLTGLDVTLTNPGGSRAELETKETFTAVTPVKVLSLALWSRAIGDVGLNSRPAEHEYVLERVTLANGEVVPFSHLDDDLLVELPRTLAADEQIELRFKISGDVLFNPGNDSYWELPTSEWFPTPARLDMQYMTYHAVVKAKKPFTAFSCGKTLRRWDEGEMACAEFAEEKPIQIPVILAGKYTTTSEERNGLTVRVSSYFAAEPKGVKKLINNAFTLVDFYKPYLGDYPFAELNIIEINSYGFGQAPAGVIFITKEAFVPLGDELSKLVSEGVNARLAHEMAHAWWGHVAKLSEQDQWLSESVAEYYSAFTISKLWRESEFKKMYGEWETQSRFVKDRSSVYMANQLSGPEAYRDRVALLYNKGPIVLHALRQELGDKVFFTIFKSFLKSFNFKLAETRHFIGLTNYVTKKDYTEWFNKYLLGTEWPKN